MITFENNNNDILSNLFSNLTYDIQEKIYNETLIIQDTERNKRYFSGIVLSEIQYYGKSNMNRLNKVYQFLDCGKRITYEEDEEYCVECDIIYDKLYYDNLDYLLKCEIDTDISIEDNEIIFHYKLKDIYKYYLYNTDFISNEIDNDFRFKYSCHSFSYDLYDFCFYDTEYEDTENEELFNEMNEMLDNNFNGYDNEKIKSLLYFITNRRLFYGRLDKYNGLLL
jgi:hypothetical protein